MKTSMQSRRSPLALCLTAVAVILSFGSFTACQNGTGDSPLAASTNADLTTLASVSDSQTATTLNALEFDFDAGLPRLADTSGTKPEAVLEIARHPISAQSTTTGGRASARFASALGVTAVRVEVSGTPYQLAAPTLNRGNRDGQRPNGTPPSLFVFPAPPASNATVSSLAPALIALGNSNVPARFTVTNYALSDNTIDVPGVVAFTSHSEGSSIARTLALNVRWSLSGSFTNGVITIHNVPDSTMLAGKTRREAEQYIRSLPKPLTKQLAAGANSVEFSAAEMGTLLAGNAAIAVGVTNLKRVNTNKAVLLAQSGSVIRVKLQ